MQGLAYCELTHLQESSGFEALARSIKDAPRAKRGSEVRSMIN
jgi:hypothetical protein